MQQILNRQPHLIIGQVKHPGHGLHLLLLRERSACLQQAGAGYTTQKREQQVFFFHGCGLQADKKIMLIFCLKMQ
jgi:hypothetical protein